MKLSDAYGAYQVNDADFEAACKNASYWAKRRILKKMTKVTWRAAYWTGSFNQVPSPLRADEDGKPVVLFVLERTKPHGVFRKDLPPSDVEEAVKRFVWLNKDKGEPTRYPTDEMLNSYAQEHQA